MFCLSRKEPWGSLPSKQRGRKFSYPILFPNHSRLGQTHEFYGPGKAPIDTSIAEIAPDVESHNIDTHLSVLHHFDQGFLGIVFAMLGHRAGQFTDITTCALICINNEYFGTNICHLAGLLTKIILPETIRPIQKGTESCRTILL